MLNSNLAPWPNFSEEEAEAVSRVLLSNRVNYWTGGEGKAFEAEFADYCGVAHGIALANGTVSLEVALEAAGVGPGDDVVCAPRTFVASATCVVRRGARPVFADVCPHSQNVTADNIREVLTKATRALVVVHHAGWPCDMPAIMTLAEERGLIVIEDCAQAHGAKIDGRPVGSFGHFGSFSFCQDKIMTTGGEGGMLVTNDRELWKRAWTIKDHGKDYDRVHADDHPPGFRWLHEGIGSNFRMTEMQAALGRLQLRRLDEWVEIRQRNAATLRATFAEHSALRVPVPKAGIKHAAYRLYAFVRPENLAEGWSRDRILSALANEGVPALSGSCSEIYLERAFSNAGLAPTARLPNAQALGESSLAFLVHPGLSASDLDRVAGAVDRIMRFAGREN